MFNVDNVYDEMEKFILETKTNFEQSKANTTGDIYV